MQVELIGKVQRQAADERFYICLAHVRVNRVPLYNHTADTKGSPGLELLCCTSTSARLPEASSRAASSMAAAAELLLCQGGSGAPSRAKL